MAKKYKPDFYKVYAEGPFDKRSQYDYEIKVSFNYVHNRDLIVRGGTFAYYWDGEQWRDSLAELVLTIDHTIKAKLDEIK